MKKFENPEMMTMLISDEITGDVGGGDYDSKIVADPNPD